MNDMKKAKFPVATHSYFKASNINEEFIKFVASSDYEPKFTYVKKLNEATIMERLSEFEPDTLEYSTLECALSGARLQTDDSELSNFGLINKKLFGTPNELYAKSVVCRMIKAQTVLNGNYLEELSKLLGKIEESEIHLGPSAYVFNKYKEYFDLYRSVALSHDHDVSSAIMRELDMSGLSKNGWVLKIVEGDSHAVTCQKTKTIKIGKEYMPRTRRASERIAVHEVYSHALRGPQDSIAESEGFALVLEQLLGKEFKLRRSYRYLAASLAVGCFGKEMTFRQVYEIIWRLMIISSRYNEEKAKKCAFDECYRVFRGGRPDIPGAVYLKDITYLQSNIDMWNMLMLRDFSYNEFVDIIEGRRTILK